MVARRKAEHEMTASELRDFTQTLPGARKMDASRAILNKVRPGVYQELEGRQAGIYPVMPNKLASRVASLLEYKTGITPRAWFALMPSPEAFDWAIKVYQAVGDGRGKSSYFLQCVLTHWEGGEKFARLKEWAKVHIEAILGPDALNEVVIANDADVMFLRDHLRETPDCMGCERCWSTQQRVNALKVSQAGEKWARGVATAG